MKVLKNIIVPTGNILIVNGEKGKLECLSIGDYGKEKNLKADFLNLTNEINGVPNGNIMPLEEKWVVTISSQYGCSMGCVFCDVPKVGKGINATEQDMVNQVLVSLSLHPEIACTKRLNIHFARMGEPTFNFDVIKCARRIRKDIRPYIGRSLVHPVVSTMMPKHNRFLSEFINEWMDVKNDDFRGDAGLQLSINSTNEREREKMFAGNAMTLEEISRIVDRNPVGRKITLNFALANYTIDELVLLQHFDPEKFLVKLTPMHMTSSCKENGLETHDGYERYYPYKDIENRLKSVGYDVIVFVPSHEEDNSKITCGNAILSEASSDKS